MDPELAFLQAVQGGHFNTVKYNITQELASAQQTNGETALMLACKNGHLNIAKLLVLYHADVNTPSSNGKTALMCAAMSGHYDVVKFLLELGPMLDVQDQQDETALMMAASHGYSNVVQILIQEGALLNLSNNNGETALMLAVRQRGPTWRPSVEHQVETVRLLVYAGCDMNHQDGQGWTTLMYLAKSNQETGLVEMLSLLLESGADPNIQNRNGLTALILACKNSTTCVIQWLASYSQLDPTILKAAQMMAYKRGHPEIINLLKQLSSQ